MFRYLSFSSDHNGVRKLFERGPVGCVAIRATFIQLQPISYTINKGHWDVKVAVTAQSINLASARQTYVGTGRLIGTTTGDRLVLPCETWIIRAAPLVLPCETWIITSSAPCHHTPPHPPNNRTSLQFLNLHQHERALSLFGGESRQ